MPQAPATEHDTLEAAVDVRTLSPGQYLVVEDGGEISVLPITADVTRIGRAIAADVRFEDPTVSRKHARLMRRGGEVAILDDRSMNGVFVNGRRVTDATLADGDDVVLGRVRMRFVSVPG